MPLVESEPRGNLRPTPLKLYEDIRRKLIAYGKFCNSSTDRVISVALTRLFAEDKEFEPFLTAHPDLLERRKRVRKPPTGTAQPAAEHPKDKK
jgi:hypothetical protein